MAKAIVVNNCPRLIIGQLPHIRSTVKTPDGKERPGSIVQNGDQVVFKPGVNIVDADTLKALRSGPFESNFKDKMKRIAAPEFDPTWDGKVFMYVAKDGLPDENPFAKLSLDEAVPLVDEVDDEETLAVWLANEGRDSVRAALYKRRDVITGVSQE